MDASLLLVYFPFSFVVSKESAKLRGEEVIVNRQKEQLVELKASRELNHYLPQKNKNKKKMYCVCLNVTHLPYRIQELCEDGRHFFTVSINVSTSYSELVSKRKPLLLY